MTNQPRQPTAPARNAGIRLCRWLWNQRGLIWGTVIFGLALNLFASWLITPLGSTFSNTPLGTIFGHPLLSALGGLGLLGLTGGVWLINRLNPVPASQSTSTRTPTQKDRQVVVDLLRKQYSKRLAQSLQGAAMLVLGLHERTDATSSSAQLVFRHTHIAQESPLPLGTSIAQAYDDARQGLLLLGAPGAGKTTLLLDLAQELFARTESDPTHPIPVILNLSSWADKEHEPPLAIWFVDQLRLIYGIPTYLGQMLLKQDQWLLLLDGLDEVNPSARNRCIEAINTYRGEHFVPLVVCSRSQEYMTQEIRLALPSAVEIQPLQEREVAEYLKRLGKQMEAVRAALRTNPVLKQLLTTPLMLSVVILTYRDKAVKDLPKLGSSEDQQRQIFARYVERMLEQHRSRGQFSPERILRSLVWLAQEMRRSSLTEFHLERLVPRSLLTTNRTQHFYLPLYLFSLFTGLFYSLLFGLVVGLFAGLLIGLIVGLLAGLPCGLTNWNMPYYKRVQLRRRALVAGLLGGPLMGLLIGLLGGPLMGLLIGLLTGPLVALGSGLGSEQLILTVPDLSNQHINDRLRLIPNWGIRLIGWKALRLGLLIGLLTGLVFGLLTSLYFGLFAGLLFGLVFGLIFGGNEYLQHYFLRFVLWCKGAIPWRVVCLLEEAAGCILLQRVGSGYRFIHPLFQEYFASQDAGASPSSLLHLSSQQS